MQAGGLVETKRSSGLLATGEVQRLERLDQERYACSGLMKTRLFLVFLCQKSSSSQGMGVEEYKNTRDGGQDRKYPNNVMELIVKVS